MTELKWHLEPWGKEDISSEECSRWSNTDQQASHCDSVGSRDKEHPFSKSWELKWRMLQYRHLYSWHINIPIKLTLPPTSPLKIEITRTRFTPWSKAQSLQVSSPDIPPDLLQYLLKVCVRIHLGPQGSPHHEPIPAEQLELLWTSVPASLTHTRKKQVSTT